MPNISEHVKDGRTTLFLSGRFDFPIHKAFQAAIEHAKHSKPRIIALNFTDVTFIDSAGLGMLMLAFNNVKEAEINLILEVPPGYTADVFDLASMNKRIPISPIPAKETPVTSLKTPKATAIFPPPPLVFELDEMQELLLPILEAIEHKTFDLPPLPQVASQVVALTTDPNATADQLRTLIQQDPILTAKIFKTANSAGAGSPRPIESLQEAIRWLGLNTVANFAVALTLKSNVFNDRGYEHEVQDLWMQAVATAFYAKTLAAVSGHNPDNAFLCGLLHSIGKLAVVHQVNQSQGASSPPLRWSVIVTLLRQSYIEVGRRLAEAWQFPTPVKEAIMFHQDYSYHLATHPSKGAPLTCLAQHLATHHNDTVAMTNETLQALPVTATLNIPKDMLKGLLKTKDVIQRQIESLLNSG